MQLAALRENKGRAGTLINSLIGEPRRLLITIYIGNELVNVAVSAMTTSIALSIFGSYGVAIAIGAGTFLLLILGEITPKTLALKSPERYTVFAVYPLKLFAIIVRPIQKLLGAAADGIIAALGLKTAQHHAPALSEEELRTIVNMGEGEGILDENERKMIHNVIEFAETTAADIMTPKIDMFTLHVNDRLEDILPQIVKNFYSRVPVYDENDEQIAGILYTKDLNRLSRDLPPEDFLLKDILHPVCFIPESKKIKELLQEFKRMKRHLAIVLDEYGSVSGLVTMEDILEEVVGEIESDMRIEEHPVIRTGADSYLLSATYSVGDFNRYFKSELPEDAFDTIGGLVFDLFGRVPRFGESVMCGDFKFLVEKMKGPRILRLHLSILEAEQPGDAEADVPPPEAA